jgi:hypothetical protein
VILVDAYLLRQFFTNRAHGVTKYSGAAAQNVLFRKK